MDISILLFFRGSKAKSFSPFNIEWYMRPQYNPDRNLSITKVHLNAPKGRDPTQQTKTSLETSKGQKTTNYLKRIQHHECPARISTPATTKVGRPLRILRRVGVAMIVAPIKQRS